MTWSWVPPELVALIEERAGAGVESVEGANFGFSPGFAGVVTFANGERQFLKVMSATRDPWSIDVNRREAEVLALLPRSVPAPALLWAVEAGEWFAFATECVEGEHPRPQHNEDHARAMWNVLTQLSRVPAPPGLPPFHEYQHDIFERWQSLASAPDRAARLASLGANGEWISGALGRLVELERDAIEASKGDVLVHGDLRADNALIAAGTVVIVDWPYASRGAPWLDLAGLLPAFEMNGGGRARAAFRAHPLASDVSVAEERAFVAALAGYFAVSSTDPPVPAISGLREFQRAQAIPALAWLREIVDSA